MIKFLIAGVFAMMASLPARGQTFYTYDILPYSVIAGISLHLGMKPRSVFSDLGKATFESKRKYAEIMGEYEAKAKEVAQFAVKDIYYKTDVSGVKIDFGQYDFDNSQQIMCIPRVVSFAPPRELSGGGTFQSVFGYVGPRTHISFFYGDSNQPGAKTGERCPVKMKRDTFLEGEYSYSGIRLQMRDDAVGEVFDQIIRQTPMTIRFICGPLEVGKHKYAQSESLMCRISSFELLSLGKGELITKFEFKNDRWVSDIF